ncbi:hypothetical protein DYB32_002426 [Aphanomyces invadans]|uniref:Kinesin motor domain-containing protein n=1 Tax=Aphanomyces invadans TaxID=157072 RepID=A0A3R7D433_9STRA|nr:hypothetical protein DYB32_002426 [Aphanomyces invadans]
MADDQEHQDLVDDVDATPREPSDNNIRIFLRVKPSKRVSGFFTWEEEQGALEYNIPKDVAAGLINNSRTQCRKFSIASAVLVFKSTAPPLSSLDSRACVSALDGFNSTIFAYGQTGSGKTFTITGGAERYEDRGIIPRSLSMIFDEMKKVDASLSTWHVTGSSRSERAHKTGAKGKVLREATYINTSLHYLEMVIVALHEKNTKGRTHIPYRNSMMTSVLRDSLGGNCKTVMVATASAEKEQTDVCESLSTCRFAQRVARVRNDAHLNEEVDPVIVIRQLKAQIVALQEELTVLKGEAVRALAIRENKALLKKKYDQAKALAAAVNDARNAIKDCTAKMEKLRKDKAVASVTGADGVVDPAPSDDEKALAVAIDAKKQEYKVGFNHLNDLKKEIQHIQKMLEMGRLKLQKDFDGWYQAHGRGHLIAETLVNGADKPEAPPAVNGPTESC